MRIVSVLALATLLASGCASPCENINAAQTDAALQTCVFSGSLNEDGAFSTEDGAPVAFSAPEAAAIEGAFPDGSQIHGDNWFAAGETPTTGRDSSRWVATTALTPEAERYALAMQADRTVRIRDASGQPLATVRVADGEDAGMARTGISGWANRATHLVFSRDGGTLYGADTQGTLYAWDAASGETLWQGTAPLDHGGQDGRAIKPDAIRGLALSDDGARLAAATTQRVDVWDAASGETLASWSIPHNKTSVIGVGWAPGGEHVAVVKSGRYVPPTVRYSSFDENGQRTDIPERRESAGYQNPPTVFLMAMP